MKTTSSESWAKLSDSPALGKIQSIVFSAIKNIGPSTAREISEFLRGINGVQKDSYHKRFSELERAGLIRTCGKVECRITGKRAMAWEIND